MIMGDMCATIKALNASGGHDHDLEDKEGVTLINEEKMILRQYEAAATPATILSKFTQDNDQAWSYVLYYIKLVLQLNRESTIEMHPGKSTNLWCVYVCVCIYVVVSDISFSSLDITNVPGTANPDLKNRGNRAILVVDRDSYTTDAELEDEYVDVIDMTSEVAKYREVYANDLEARLSLNEDSLPTTMAVSALLNPMFGRKPTIVGSGMMTETQYENAERTLLHMMIDILDAKNPNLDADDDSDSEDSRDGSLPPVNNGSNSQAQAELTSFFKYKKAKYLPDVGGSFHELYNELNREIRVGSKVQNKGEDLPSEANLTDYLNKKGRFNILRFFEDHKTKFPTLYIIAQCMGSRRVVEVGCERFFSLSGYISAPRRTRLGVRTYERLATLSSNIKRVYVDPKKVKAEYLRRCKSKLWKKTNEDEAVRCWNLERLIVAELNQQPAPDDLTVDDLIKEGEEKEKDVITID